MALDKQSTETFNFTYTLEKHGWSELCVKYNDSHYVIVISHTFSSPLYDIANFISDLDTGKMFSQVIFYGEPGGEVMMYKRNNKQHDYCTLEIKNIDSEFGENLVIGESIINITIKAELLSNILFAELAKTKLLLNMPWYAKDRYGDFPYKEFALLAISRKNYI